MATRTRADDQDEPADIELYLPAGIPLATDATQLESLWGRLFNYGVEAPERS